MMRVYFFCLSFFLCFSALAEELVVYGEQVSTFKVDVMKTAEQKERGLMFKTSIPDDYGMVFEFSPPRMVSMWMKNTYIPLDMIFYDENFLIVKIIKNAIPHDLSLLSSDRDVLGVVEVNAGIVDRFKIKVGDKVELKK